MQESTLAIIAIVAALGLIGVTVVETLATSLQVHATPVITNGGGCSQKGFTSSNGHCPLPITNVTTGRSFHP